MATYWKGFVGVIALFFKLALVYLRLELLTGLQRSTRSRLICPSFALRRESTNFDQLAIELGCSTQALVQ